MTCHRLIAVAVVGSLCALSACGSDDKSSDSPKKVAIKVTESGKTSKIEVPKSMKAGLTEFSLDNSGKAPHSAQLIRVEGGHSSAEVAKVTNSDGGKLPGWLHGAGGVGTVAPGKSGTSTEILKPGAYYVQDDEGDRNSSFAKTTVTGKAGGELPSTAATVVAKEYQFKPSGLKAGSNRITFENSGKELHHLIALPIKKGAKFAAVRKFVTTQGKGGGPPPVDFENSSSTTVLDGGAKQVTDLDLKKGKYAFVCFIQDRKGGPPHAVKGMLQEETIK